MTPSPVTLTDRLRTITNRWMSQIGLALHRIGIHPDVLTVAGLVVVVVAAVNIANGRFQTGGLILLLGLPLDALDGAVARAMQRKGKFGGVLDSTLDRYADGLIFGGIGYAFALQGRMEYTVLALAALLGAFTVSYVRARAGEAGLSVKIGLFSRLERVAVLLVMLLIPVQGLLEIGLWVLAIGTNISGLQRLWYVYRHIDEVPGPDDETL
ncbi:MAG: CDP-alcohol phosphatidyltransferase family protein [Anaerolineaceae bacterium]|nr:CDP-alcohol phosphatidyltransferase family protein [Anaerolineaceae bacterium]